MIVDELFVAKSDSVASVSVYHEEVVVFCSGESVSWSIAELRP